MSSAVASSTYRAHTLMGAARPWAFPATPGLTKPNDTRCGD